MLHELIATNPVRLIVISAIVVGCILEGVGVISVGTTSGIVLAVLALISQEAIRRLVYSPDTAYAMLDCQDEKAGIVHTLDGDG